MTYRRCRGHSPLDLRPTAFRASRRSQAAPNQKRMHATLVTIKLKQLKASKAKQKTSWPRGTVAFYIWILEYSNDSSVSVAACTSA